MAAGYMRELSKGKVEVLSAGSAPKETINPQAIAVMAEEGIDIANQLPKILTTEAVLESDAVVTMGCGDACPFYPIEAGAELLAGPRGSDLRIESPWAGRYVEDKADVLNEDEIEAQWEYNVADPHTPRIDEN